MPLQIPFHKLYLTGKETDYMRDALQSGKISGNGTYTKSCCAFLESNYQFKKVFLTSSCTDALEMMAVLLDIKPGDRIIAPSYTFVSTVNPFVLRGAEIDFADSLSHHPNMDPDAIERLITPKTKAVIVVHYAGMAADLDRIAVICHRHGIPLLEDAAQCIGATYRDQYLGSFGTFGALSFHDTKNITAGEGGALVVNDERYISRAEVIWEKGTNRNAFIRGEVSKYEWVDKGSSYLCSDLNAACLLAQLEEEHIIRYRRQQLWHAYEVALRQFGGPEMDASSRHNAHIYYLKLESEASRNLLINWLAENQISAVSHYTALHESPYFLEHHPRRSLPNASDFAGCLLRLPIYPDLSDDEQQRVIQVVTDYFLTHNSRSV